MSDIRVRFAPSPTGPLHIGGLRTALFNYLFARKHNGTFILRIEDTDQTRYVPQAEKYILDSLEWCGIKPDEGVGAGGAFGPYRQSERKSLYEEYARQLVASGHGYYAFDTPEELERLRNAYESRKEVFTYDAVSRVSLKNSIALPPEKVKQFLKEGIPYVIRFMYEPDQEIIMNDRVRGEVRVNSSTLDDKILYKSDGMPTYHLANVVDDHEMKISHVIRGEEWLPSLPLHISLYQAFGWNDSMPQFAHLPLILKPNGKGKLSKRDGDKGGFPVFPLEWKDENTGEVSSGYRESGYFPEACLNILALLGWNPGTEKEIYTLEELISDFDLENVGRSGAKFDPEKARWFNHQYLQEADVDELTGLFMEILAKKQISAPQQSVKTIVELIRERADFVADLWEQSDFFFMPPESYDEQVIKKRWKEDTPELMQSLAEILESAEPFNAEHLESLVKGEIATRQWNMGAVMNAWRLLLVGASRGPSLFTIAELLGKEEVLRRIRTGIEKIG